MVTKIICSLLVFSTVEILSADMSFSDKLVMISTGEFKTVPEGIKHSLNGKDFEFNIDLCDKNFKPRFTCFVAGSNSSQKYIFELRSFLPTNFLLAHTHILFRGVYNGKSDDRYTYIPIKEMLKDSLLKGEACSTYQKSFFMKKLSDGTYELDPVNQTQYHAYLNIQFRFLRNGELFPGAMSI